MKNRRPHNAGFDARMETTVLVVSIFVTFLLLFLAALPLFTIAREGEGHWVALIVPALMLTILIVAGLFSIRGYAIHGEELLIRRTFWNTRIPLGGLQKATPDPEAMKRSFKVCGNGGFLAFSGWYRSKRLGSFRPYVTERKNSVVLTFEDGRTIVVSPDDPARFVKALGMETRRNA